MARAKERESSWRNDAGAPWAGGGWSTPNSSREKLKATSRTKSAWSTSSTWRTSTTEGGDGWAGRGWWPATRNTLASQQTAPETLVHGPFGGCVSGPPPGLETTITELNAMQLDSTALQSTYFALNEEPEYVSSYLELLSPEGCTEGHEWLWNRRAAMLHPYQ